jgi:aspartate/methionine/tyrosine aminotransferase
MHQFLSERPNVRTAAPPSASVVFPRLAGADDAGAFIAHALDRHGVAVAPGRFFESPGHFRVSLAGEPETFARSLDALGRALDDWPPRRRTTA